MSWPNIIVAFLFAAMLMVAGADFLQITHSQTPPVQCVSVEERERIRTTVIEGIDEALRAHVVKLFDVWMKDTSNQPARAIEGMEAGISAHIRARTNALNWNPPPCKGDLK
jgi:hypothetical protein